MAILQHFFITNKLNYVKNMAKKRKNSRQIADKAMESKKEN